MQLSRDYFTNIAGPQLKLDFPGLYPHLAAGLAGNGSECFGYDDLISQDHDWGVDFYIWTADDDRDMIPELSEWKDKLFALKPPEHTRTRSEYGARVGVMTCGDFYSGLIGTQKCPETLNEWIRVPEENFAMAVNGEVFIDGSGKFIDTRSALLGFYPEDIRRKKIAAKCMALAQTGQYNHERTARRRDWVTLRSVLARFTDNAISMAFLLNKVYKPYYKWAYRALKELPVIGGETASLLLRLSEAGGLDSKSLETQTQCVAELCSVFARELNFQGLSETDDWFLAAHGEEVQRRIKDGFLRALPVQYEI